MRLLLTLVLWSALPAMGQSVPANGAIQPSKPVEAMVQKLYEQVMVHRPIGTMWAKERKVFYPYLSKELVSRMASANACAADYFHRHRDPNEKPPFAWLELGTFSGGDDESALRSFQIERSSSPENNGFDVDVRLRWGDTRDSKPWFSRVKVVVKPVNGKYLVDDLIYLGEDDYPRHERLSEILSISCHGGHWID